MANRRIYGFEKVEDISWFGDLFIKDSALSSI